MNWGRAFGKLILMVALLALPSSAQFRADTILSVLRMNDVVFVSTRTGLFQSTLSQQKWTPVKLPKGVLPGGCLNHSDPGVTKIYYSPPLVPLTDRSDRCAVGFGLWMSADSGKIWKKVDATHWFKSVLARKDGTLYASARVPSDKSNVVAELEIYGGSPLASTDGGKTWKDTTGAEPLPAVISLGTCANNPAHVCAGGMGVRGYNMEYAPDSRKWTVTPSLPATDPKDTTAEEYLDSGAMGSSTSECCYMQQATLENYYSLGFEDVLQRLGVTLETEKKHYEFSAGAGPKIVNVVLNLLPGVQGTSAIALLDLDDTEVCWGLRYVDPAGAKREAAPLIMRLNNPALGHAHLVEVGKPYHRQVDLEGLEPLRKPGLYRMVLIFDNGKLKKKDENVWTGRIVGTAVFEVEIK